MLFFASRRPSPPLGLSRSCKYYKPLYALKAFQQGKRKRRSHSFTEPFTNLARGLYTDMERNGDLMVYSMRFTGSGLSSEALADPNQGGHHP